MSPDTIVVVDAESFEQGEIVRDAVLDKTCGVVVDFRCERQTPMFIAGMFRSAPGPMRKWLAAYPLTLTGVKSPEARRAAESARDRLYADPGL